MGILGFALFILLGITSLPSVSNALSWREFSFIQCKLGYVTLFLCTFHAYLYGWDKFLRPSTYKWYTAPGYLLALVVPTVVLVLKLLLLLPCVDHRLMRIRRAGSALQSKISPHINYSSSIIRFKKTGVSSGCFTYITSFQDEVLCVPHVSDLNTAAVIQDLSGKVFTFPQQTNSAHVKITTPKNNFAALTVCHRSFTDLKRDHGIFSMALPSSANEFLLFYRNGVNAMEPHVKTDKVAYTGLDYKLNQWHSICTTWESSSGVVQLWFNGQPLTRKYVPNSQSAMSGTPIIVLGQEQDSHGGGFDINQSFVGMMTDVHMWDYMLSPCEIQKYMSETSFTPGNVLNWAALDFVINGRVLIENKQMYCGFNSHRTFKLLMNKEKEREIRLKMAQVYIFLSLLLGMSAALPQDMSGKMLIFPQETNTAHVRITTSRQNLGAVTVCLRYFTDLVRAFSVFSLATPSFTNDFTFFMNANSQILVRDIGITFKGLDYQINRWQSICATWDAASGVVQLWVNGKPSAMKFVTNSNISGPMIIVIGQDQDSYGGRFEAAQSFVGMMTDVHMWIMFSLPVISKSTCLKPASLQQMCSTGQLWTLRSTDEC
ncbi:hypothetical protein WMY93_025996 [Mugilogobius chulae]|uniref:Pentraxin (PTX) domain-containing protein n=1 Tax=Mugilogobius chulae TaxID=88201 RepID=A0AAW0N1Y2_9GOBI